MKNKSNPDIVIIVFLLLGVTFLIYLYDNPITRNLGDLSDWVGSLLTVAVIFVAIKQIRNESELAREERQYQVMEKKLEIASPIFCFIENDRKNSSVIVENRTDYPIYDVIIGIVQRPRFLNVVHPKNDISELKEKTDIKENYWPLSGAFTEDMYRVYQVLPKRKIRIEYKTHGGGMGKTEGVGIAFMDSRGNYWVRETWGDIFEVVDYSLYFKFTLPDYFVYPEIINEA